MTRKTSDKVLLSAKDSVPPPGYTGRNNMSYESEQEFERINGTREGERSIHGHYSNGAKARYHNGKLSNGVKNKKIESICLCTASVYPHYHGETLIDGNVYDEILIIDPKELQETSNKSVRFKGQCLRICKLFAMIIIVIAGLACGLYGVIHYFIINKGKEAIMTNGDVKLLQYSTYFCESVKTEASDIARSMIVIKRHIGQTASFNYNITKELKLDPNQKVYERSFYAIEQGMLEITIKSEEDVDVLIFDKQYKLDAWKNNKNYPGYVFKRTCCKAVTTDRGLYEFRTKQDRQAFLAVHSTVPTNASLIITFKRTFIDYEKTGEKCFAKEKATCNVPVSFASDDKIVSEIPRSSPAFISRKVEWICEARVWFYVLVFAGIFLVFILLVCIFYCILKYCFCDPCCCCFCCYIVPKEKEKPKVVQYHRSTSNLMRTPRGPRADHMRTLQTRTSNESIINHGYTTSDTSDAESHVMTKRRDIARTNSEVTTQSEASTRFSRRRSSSIGSDIKQGMFVDENYEELPHDDEMMSNGKVIIEMNNDDVDGYARASKKRKSKASENRMPKDNHEKSDGYISDIEIRLQKKRAQFSDSEEDDGTDSDDYDNTYDIVGFKMADASKSTAEKIDTLPLGPSGAPPRAPPKSAASLKGKPGLKGIRSLENLEILPNGMTRLHTEKLQKSKSDAVNRKGRKPSPITPKIIVISSNDRKRSDIYGTYDRGRKSQNEKNGLYNRTISLDSGLDNIDGRKHAKIRPAVDVKF